MSELDKGAIFERQFTVTPCSEGSFILRTISNNSGMMSDFEIAFSDVFQLMDWLTTHATVQPKSSGNDDALPSMDDYRRDEALKMRGIPRSLETRDEIADQ